MPGAALRVAGLACRVADGQRLREILRIESLFLRAGSLVGIRGRSGAGKTTFLRLISGILLPQAGTIRWDDAEITAMKAPERDRWRGRNIGFLYQDFRLFEGLTSLENVLLPLTFYGNFTSRQREEAKAALEKIGVSPSTPAGLLSRGEMQRTALVRVLMQSPRVILADEPTASLDAENARRVLDMLEVTARSLGATLLMVSHDESVLARFSTVLNLEAGTLAASPGRARR